MLRRKDSHVLMRVDGHMLSSALEFDIEGQRRNVRL